MLIYIAQYIQKLKRCDCGKINISENQKFAELIINYIKKECSGGHDLLTYKCNIQHEHDAYIFIECFLKLFNNIKYCSSIKLSKFITNRFEYTYVHCDQCSLCGYENEQTETTVKKYILVANVNKSDIRLKLQDVINNNNKISFGKHNCNACNKKFILHNVYRKFITLPLYLIIYIHKDANAVINVEDYINFNIVSSNIKFAYKYEIISSVNHIDNNSYVSQQKLNYHIYTCDKKVEKSDSWNSNDCTVIIL